MLELERDGGLARIFLNRPQKVNALDSACRRMKACAPSRLPAGAKRSAAAPMSTSSPIARALRLQKELLRQWEEQPLSAPRGPVARRSPAR
jgi:hypothetical protein